MAGPGRPTIQTVMGPNMDNKLFFHRQLTTLIKTKAYQEALAYINQSQHLYPNDKLESIKHKISRLCSHDNHAINQWHGDEASEDRQKAADYLDSEFTLRPPGPFGNNYNQQKADPQYTSKEDSLSIIITAFNKPAELELCLAAVSRALKSINPEEVEVILVDDGSTIDYTDIYNRYSPIVSCEFYWIRLPDMGYRLAKARNHGASAARNEILLFLDSDILIPEDFLKQVRRYHFGHKRRLLTGIRRFTKTQLVDPEEVISGAMPVSEIPGTISSNTWFSKYRLNNATFDWRLPLFYETDYLAKCPNPYDYFNGGHSSIRRSVFAKIGGYNEAFTEWGHEDRELAYRAYCEGCFIVPIKTAQTLHIEDKDDTSAEIDMASRIHGNQISHSKYLALVPPSRWNASEAEKSSYKTSGQVQGIPPVPTFSVYMPAHNAAKYIESAIKSVLSQGYSDWELIIVENGSTDQTFEIAQSFAELDPRIKAYSIPAKGIGYATNQALNLCKGHFIVQLDADDLLHQACLLSFYEFMQANPEYDLAYSKYMAIDEKGHPLFEGYAENKFSRHLTLVGMTICHARCFKRRLWGLIQDIGVPTDITNAIDYSLYLQLSMHADIAHLDKALYYYRVNMHSTSQAKRRDQLLNHTKVVNRYLTQIGVDDYHAQKLDGFYPGRNYIVKKADKPSLINRWGFEGRVHIHLQPLIESALEKLVQAPGNDYSCYSAKVKEYWEDKDQSFYSEKVSIIVPAYNRAKRLSRCLAGIKQQSYPQELIEVVVVDDGSSDEIQAVVRKYETILNLKYSKQLDKGYRLSEARNLGIRLSSHPNISIIDCDLIPLPSFIEEFMKYLHVFPNLILLGHQSFVDPSELTDDDILNDPNAINKLEYIRSENSTMTEAEEYTVDWRYSIYEETDCLRKDKVPFRAFSSGHVAYKKKAIEEAGYYDTDFNVWGCEDNEAGYRLMKRGYYFVPVLEAQDLHQEPPSGKNETDRISDRVISRSLLQDKCPPTRGWFGEYKLNDPSHCTPYITIAIPAYNADRFIEQAIASASSQSEESIEILVYDDCSSDSTHDILKNIQKTEPRLRIYRENQNKGVYHARNWLLNNAKGEFVAFLDADDLLHPQLCSEVLSTFKSNPDVGLITTKYQIIDEEGSFVNEGYNPSSYDLKEGLVGNIFTHCRVIRVRDWHRCQKPSLYELDKLQHGEDLDLCLRLAQVSRIDRIDKSLYSYRICSEGNSLTSLHSTSIKSDLTLHVINSFLSRIGLSDRARCFSTYNDDAPFEVYLSDPY